jgi:hypothetical protein
MSLCTRLMIQFWTIPCMSITQNNHLNHNIHTFNTRFLAYTHTHNHQHTTTILNTHRTNSSATNWFRENIMTTWGLLLTHFHQTLPLFISFLTPLIWSQVHHHTSNLLHPLTFVREHRVGALGVYHEVPKEQHVWP